ncbi:putative nonselective cation channel protein [Eutypa lata UCREL1]|uniref:Putative nonselective cation channel protein n=1 Tax=Eutypa lata (strain UCR-EL1) TaxID=1287681 RepID=M7SS28_EUTLA|nr:putative nonselective cation channel protein [Eutypa lata UCREL1]
MMADFTALTALSAWCFCGFLLSMFWLAEGRHNLVKWMLWIWFGLDGSGVQNSTDFHWLLGPILMVTFAFLGNTLFLTILVSMLSNTFGTIVANATAEIAFRRAVVTLEGVKGDAIFAYQPPFNIIALFVLVPMRFFVNARWFHKIHVATVRAINVPILLIIALLERRLLWPDADYIQDVTDQLPKKSRRSNGWFWEKWKITTHGDIQAVFEIAPPSSVVEDITVDDELTHHMIRRQFGRQQSSTIVSAGGGKRNSDDDESGKAFVPKTPSRRDSIAPFGDLSEQIRDIMNETVGVENLSNRIDELERSTSRIEKLLGKLCGDTGGDGSVTAEEQEQSGFI